MFSANSPFWLNSVHNPGAITAQYTGVSNPLGLSNNNAFGRVWPANSPFDETGIGSSSILDPTGQPLAGPPNPKIGGVYVGSLTNRDQVFAPPQVIPGAKTRLCHRLFSLASAAICRARRSAASSSAAPRQ